MKIYGTFYFAKTKSGNLLGEFTNNGLKEYIVESANINKDFCKDNFEAEYITNWLEDEETFIAKLIIERNSNNNKMFDLTWRNIKNNELIFKGIAFKKRKILIGNYNGK